LAHVDDVDIIAISQTALKEAFVSLEKGAGEFGLMINEVKNNYLTTRVNRNKPKHYKIENFIFETVQIFTSMSSFINVNRQFC
jgi:hypothetical protein